MATIINVIPVNLRKLRVTFSSPVNVESVTGQSVWEVVCDGEPPFVVPRVASVVSADGNEVSSVFHVETDVEFSPGVYYWITVSGLIS